jgi:hypothetical protein
MITNRNFGKLGLLTMAMASMGLMNDTISLNDEPQIRVKTQLTKKQNKARSASKRARRARRVNRN